MNIKMKGNEYKSLDEIQKELGSLGFDEWEKEIEILHKSMSVSCSGSELGERFCGSIARLKYLETIARSSQQREEREAPDWARRYAKAANLIDEANYGLIEAVFTRIEECKKKNILGEPLLLRWIKRLD